MFGKWYHISDEWKEYNLTVHPRETIRPDDPDDPRDLKPCIHVCPSFAQCIIAIGAWYDYNELRVYETECEAIPAPWVFDYEFTEEHRIYEPTNFRLIKKIYPDQLKIPKLTIYDVSDIKFKRNAKQTLINLSKIGDLNGN
jgi:hypothetical protein